jgi:hypothetical protein
MLNLERLSRPQLLALFPAAMELRNPDDQVVTH